MEKYIVPMLESERGWGAKIDGYCGPFDSFEAAENFRRAYNEKYNNEPITPDWYISAQEPRKWDGEKCDGIPDLSDKERDHG